MSDDHPDDLELISPLGSNVSESAAVAGLLESTVSEEFHAVDDADLFNQEGPITVEEVVDEWATGVEVPLGDLANYAPPDTGATAQVVLVVTSLGSFRRQFFGSKRAQHFLDCKGLVYHLIDANRDVSQGIDLKDQEFLEEWGSRGLLSRQEGDEKARFSIPQVLIDGVSIGDAIALQDMEEDGDLDWVAVRAACPACLNERDPTDAQCKQCGVQYFELIPPEVIHNKQVQRFCRGQQYFDVMPTVHHLRYTEAIANIDHEEVEPQALTYESLFGEPPPPED